MATRKESRRELENVPPMDAGMAHLFRGELSRSDTWRTRLDTTTNWAITTTAAVISFSFANPQVPHVTLLVGIWMVVSFLLIEARRYRYYDLFNRRVRLMEDGYWAPMLRREPIDPDAIRELASELARPQIQLSLFSAISTRLNRAYGPILFVLVVTWFVKVFTHPTLPTSVREFTQRARIGFVPGFIVMVLLGLGGMLLVYLFVASFVVRAPLGELRTRPRTRRRMFESFYRPYEIKAPRSPRRAR